MPPKGAKKGSNAVVKSEKPKTEKPKALDPPEKPKPTTPRKKPSAPKPKEEEVWTALAKPNDQVIPVDVSFMGEKFVSKNDGQGTFFHKMKLDAPGQFKLCTSIFITEGEFKGYQAILIEPAKPFDFKGLSPQVQKLIYEFYFAPQGIVGASIAIDGKRVTHKEPYAKTYSNGSKNRVALLAVNKEINQQATPIFYDNAVKFADTQIVTDFLSEHTLGSNFCTHITKIEIGAWNKTNSRIALNNISNCGNLKELHFEQGIFAEADAVKAAKYFTVEAHKLLEALQRAKGSGDKAVDVLRFGPMALTFKDADKSNAIKPWIDAVKAEFMDELREKMATR